MEENKKKIVERKLSEEDLERLEILQKSEEIKGEQLLLNLDSELVIENEVEKLLGQQIDDPVTKFQLYYNGLAKLLKNNLQKGKDYEDVRRIVYDKKIYLLTEVLKKMIKASGEV